MLVGQLLGLVGVFLLVLMFQVNNRQGMLRIQILLCLVWSAHYMAMGAFTGSGLIFLGALRSYAFDKFRQHEGVFIVFVVAFAIATLVTWKDWTSIMALIGMLLATVAMWQENPRHIRLISLTIVPFWLTYNILNGTYFGATADLITLTSLVVAIVRFDIPPQAWLHFRPGRSIETIEAQSDKLIV